MVKLSEMALKRSGLKRTTPVHMLLRASTDRLFKSASRFGVPGGEMDYMVGQSLKWTACNIWLHMAAITADLSDVS